MKPSQHCKIIAQACMRLGGPSQRHQMHYPSTKSNVGSSLGSPVSDDVQWYTTTHVQKKPKEQSMQQNAFVASCSANETVTEKHPEVVDLTSASSQQEPNDAAGICSMLQHCQS